MKRLELITRELMMEDVLDETDALLEAQELEFNRRVVESFLDDMGQVGRKIGKNAGPSLETIGEVSSIGATIVELIKSAKKVQDFLTTKNMVRAGTEVASIIHYATHIYDTIDKMNREKREMEEKKRQQDEKKKKANARRRNNAAKKKMGISSTSSVQTVNPEGEKKS